MSIEQPISIYPTPATARGQKAKKVSLPPPIGGWNTRDDPVQMQSTDATHLVNFFPEINQVRVRRGFNSHATGVGSGNVDTVVEFFDGSTRKLLATSPTNIYNATAAGAASSLAGSFTEGKWQTAMMDGIMGLVNGADAPQTFNGTAIAAMTVSGPTIANLIGIHVFKSRSYFWEDGSQSFWYSATNALGGALTEFALGEIARKGGKLLVMSNWTVDGGSGTDDFAVFIMSSGEVLVYQGSDPGDSTDWALVGSYTIPTPLDIRGIEKVGAEVMVMTDTDIVYLPSAFDDPSPPPTKLKGVMGISGPIYRANVGWQALNYPKRTMLILNVPISATQFEQYVINTATGAPCRFIGQNARSWTTYNDELYFGSTDGVVYNADNGTTDDTGDIDCDARQAWSDLGTPGLKVINAFRPIFSATTSFNMGADIGYDFTNAVVNRASTSGGSGVAWGSPWGTPWASNSVINQEWIAASGVGQTISVQISLAVQDERPAWYRTDMLVAEGTNI